MTVESAANKVHDLLKTSIPKSVVGDFSSLTVEGVAIKLSTDLGVSRYFGGVSDNIYRPTVTLVARSESYATASEWLHVARSILDGYREGNDFALFVETPTEYVGRDESKMHEFNEVFKILIKE